MVLGALRMPILLAVSGFFAANRISLGWGNTAPWVRAGKTYYLYAIWVPVLALFYALIGDARMPHFFEGLGGIANEYFEPTTPLWFILAISIYMVALSGCRSVDERAVLGALGVVSVISVAVGDAEINPALKIPEFFVFFAMGAYAAPWLKKCAEKPSTFVSLAALCLLACSCMLSSLEWSGLPAGALFLIRGAAGVVVGFILVGRLSRFSGLTSGLTFVGRRTLQIYVLHIPLVLLLILIPENWVRPAVDFDLVSSLMPVVITVAVIAGCLGLHQLLVAMKLDFFFVAPAIVERFIARVHHIFGGVDRSVRRRVSKARRVTPRSNRN